MSWSKVDSSHRELKETKAYIKEELVTKLNLHQIPLLVEKLQSYWIMHYAASVQYCKHSYVSRSIVLILKCISHLYYVLNSLK